MFASIFKPLFISTTCVAVIGIVAFLDSPKKTDNDEVQVYRKDLGSGEEFVVRKRGEHATTSSTLPGKANSDVPTSTSPSGTFSVTTNPSSLNDWILKTSDGPPITLISESPVYPVGGLILGGSPVFLDAVKMGDVLYVADQDAGGTVISRFAIDYKNRASTNSITVIAQNSDATGILIVAGAFKGSVSTRDFRIVLKNPEGSHDKEEFVLRYSESHGHPKWETLNVDAGRESAAGPGAATTESTKGGSENRDAHH